MSTLKAVWRPWWLRWRSRTPSSWRTLLAQRGADVSTEIADAPLRGYGVLSGRGRHGPARGGPLGAPPAPGGPPAGRVGVRRGGGGGRVPVSGGRQLGGAGSRAGAR